MVMCYYLHRFYDQLIVDSTRTVVLYPLQRYTREPCLSEYRHMVGMFTYFRKLDVSSRASRRVLVSTGFPLGQFRDSANILGALDSLIVFSLSMTFGTLDNR